MDHAAINVRDLDWNIRFFEDVFGYTVTKEGTADNGRRQVWISGGLQLVPADEAAAEGGIMNHIAFTVSSRAIKCRYQNAEHFFRGLKSRALPAALF